MLKVYIGRSLVGKVRGIGRALSILADKQVRLVESGKATVKDGERIILTIDLDAKEQ